MHLLLLISLLLVTDLQLRADGFPFLTSTREVTIDNVRLRLTETQQERVAAEGKITFTTFQLSVLKKIYPELPDSVCVISATFNDNLERFEGVPVDCIWTAPDEIAITLPKQSEGEKFVFNGIDSCSTGDFRISPDGRLFHKGKRVTIEMAFEIIAASRKAGSHEKPGSGLTVTCPPPYQSEDDYYVELNKKAEVALETLKTYGDYLKMTIGLAW